MTGIDGDFKGSLTAYHDFKEKLTGVELTQKEKEEIILNIVLFGDDKKLLKQRLKKNFRSLPKSRLIQSLHFRIKDGEDCQKTIGRSYCACTGNRRGMEYHNGIVGDE